jgi:thiamine-phosphate pyrophosphorylase
LLGKLGPYVITARIKELGRDHLDIAKEAILGGAAVIQLREKNMSTREMYEVGVKLKTLTEKLGVKFIINDRLDIALAVGADGVHLGQDDLPVSIARNIGGKNMIIGVSASNVKEACLGEKAGADYIGLGPIFNTPSKDDAGKPIGLKVIKEVKKAVSIPVIAIGGINQENAKKVLTAGADNIAVISAVACAKDMRMATRRLFEILKNIKGD